MTVFFDSTVSAFICFMVSLAIFNYKKVDYPLNLFLALIISLIIFVLLVAILKRSAERKIKSKQDKLLYGQFCSQLCCQSKEYIASLLLNAVKKSGYNAVKEGSIIIIDNKTHLFNICSFDKISPDKIIKCYKLTPEGCSTAILCTEPNGDANNLVNNLSAKITLIPLTDLFIYLKQEEQLPEITVKITKSKKRFRDLIKESFAKKRSGHFFYVGAIMLVFSFFVFYPKYYLIMGTFFCIVGLTCLLYGKKT